MAGDPHIPVCRGPTRPKRLVHPPHTVQRAAHIPNTSLPKMSPAEAHIPPLQTLLPVIIPLGRRTEWGDICTMIPPMRIFTPSTRTIPRLGPSDRRFRPTELPTASCPPFQHSMAAIILNPSTPRSLLRRPPTCIKPSSRHSHCHPRSMRQLLLRGCRVSQGSRHTPLPRLRSMANIHNTHSTHLMN